MTIWKITPPNSFQVFIEREVCVVLHVWPNDIMSHYITIEPFHHLGFVSPFHQFSISPFSPFHHSTISPFHHFDVLPFHHSKHTIIFLTLIFFQNHLARVKVLIIYFFFILRKETLLLLGLSPLLNIRACPLIYTIFK